MNFNAKKFALIAEHHPAYAGNFGTLNLIKTLSSSPHCPFQAIVATDIAGPNPISGSWDNIPTLALFRPRSLIPNYSIGLGLLDNLFFRLQTQKVARFLKKHKIERLFALIANNPRYALFVANLPCSISRDIYLVDDFVEDSHIYRVKKKIAQHTLNQLITTSERVFSISPVYATDLQARYRCQCQFLPLPIADFKLNEIKSVQHPQSTSSKYITIHHSGQVHHLYADALASFIILLKRFTDTAKFKIRLELWGDLRLDELENALKINLLQLQNDNFNVILCGLVSPGELIKEQKRADFLLLVNSFLPTYENQVRCSFSSKTSEYLVAGSPILVYAPPYSSLVSHLGKHKAAHIVCTENSDQALAAINDIFSRPKSKDVVKAACGLAQTYHSSEAFSHKVFNLKM